MTTQTPADPSKCVSTVNVLLVDDDDIDVIAIQRAFKREKILNPIFVARDGLEALNVLRGTEGKDPLPRPYIILLDLNMPRMGGLEFLDELRKDADHAQAIVFVLTSSNHDQDRLAAYGQHVAAYIVKKEIANGFAKRVTDLLDAYWRIVVMPE